MVKIDRLTNILKACRLNQWTKNLIVFLAPLFAFSGEYSLWISTFEGFLSFCLISSSIYLINDCVDKESDKSHPRKSLRPIASGLVPIKSAIIISILLLIMSLFIGINLNSDFLLILICYFIIQILYCFKLKRIPLIEFFCISSGFILRSTSGGVAAGIYISPWFFLSVGMLSLYLAIVKRKAELILIQSEYRKTREVLKSYSLGLIDKYESILSSCIIMTYSLWAYGPSVGGAKSPWMIITVPIVIIGIFRYQMLGEAKNQNKANIIETPEKVILHDNPMKIIIFFWLIITIYIGILN